jgi:hypothetical protein
MAIRVGIATVNKNSLSMFLMRVIMPALLDWWRGAMATLSKAIPKLSDASVRLSICYFAIL